jgi:hypoxanthine-DNA glycosylase
MYVRGFPPISRADARILILGSMPSRESLARGQYYAHPRNAFWPIMCDLFSIPYDAYEARALALKRQRVAVWDVLKACFRSSSLDSDIDDKTLVTNDFQGFFAAHSQIGRVYFNGAKAESVYRGRILPDLPDELASKALRRLPSTSPAHAGLKLEEKIQAWRAILDEGLE